MIPFLLMTIKNEEDKSKISKLFEEYYSLMMYVAKGILKDHALSEDAVSDSLLKIIYNIHKFEEISSPKTRGLIVIIVRNTAIDIYKKMMRNKWDNEVSIDDITDKSISVSDEIIGVESYNKLVDIFDLLPDSLRDVAELALVYEYSNKEIAEILDINYETVRKRALRARNFIKNKLLDMG